MESIITLEFVKVAFLIGIVMSFYFSDRHKMNPGGLIVPGYLVFFFDSPMSILVTFVLAFVTYAIIEYVLKRKLIIFGKRKFMLTLFTGTLLTMIVDSFVWSLGHSLYAELGFISIIIPGLMANEFERSGRPFVTSIVTLILAGVVFFITMGLIQMEVLPFVYAALILVSLELAIAKFLSYELTKKIGNDPLLDRRSHVVAGRMVQQFGEQAKPVMRSVVTVLAALINFIR